MMEKLATKPSYRNSKLNYPKFSFLPSSFQYSSSLNGVIAVDGKKIEILDLHLAQLCLQEEIIHRETDDDESKGICKFLEDEDKLIVAYSNRVGCRSTNGGEHIFLNTILQVAEVPKNGKVTIELDIVKTGLLLNGLERCLKEMSQSTTTNKNKAHLQDVITSLKNLYESAVMKMKDSICPDVKWTTINLTMDHEMLLNVFNMVLLMSKQKREPELPIIGDILQRLTCLEKMKFDSLSSEKRLMFNEVDRLQTFNLWPHMNYKWALPGPMSEAGFYHPHSSAKGAAGIDRVMCFTCSVCLVSWESSDQPWSEHKRHSPNCPFIKGDYTENVPLNVYTSTAYAEELSRPNDKIICMSSSSCNSLVAAGTKEGYIVIFETHPMLKIHSEYQITVSAMKSSSEASPSNEPSKPDDKLESNKQFTVKDVTPLSNLALQAAEENNEKCSELNEALSPNSTLEGSFDTLDKSVDNLSEVDINGEKYCMISAENMGEPKQSSKKLAEVENLNSSKKDESKNDVEKSDINVSADSKTDCNERKSKSRTIERNCKITSVVIINDNAEKYIVSGVKIESKKSRKSKTKQKFKLALLLYKIASFSKVSSNKDTTHTTTSYPAVQNNSPNVYPFFGSNYVEDFMVGSDDEFMMEDTEASQLAVIDEYLMASQKNPSAHGGTQNIALSGSEIKTGFDQEEVIKKDSQFTIYEDCVFHKYDVDRNLFNSNMAIVDLFVVESYLVAVLQNEKYQEKTLCDTLLVLKIDSKSKNSISVELVMKYTFPENIFIKDTLQVPSKHLSLNFLKNLKSLDDLDTNKPLGENGSVPSDLPKSLLLFALSDKTCMFFSIPQMNGIKIPTNCENDIHKIAFCSAISSIAICDVEGNFSLCQYTMSKENIDDTAFNNIITDPVNRWKGPYSEKELHLLNNLTKFESATQSCYVFFPVNWCVTRPHGVASPNSLIKSDSSMKHLLRLSPVQMDKKLIKRNEQLDVKLSKDDFTFKMFILVQSTIGYFEIFVHLKSPLKEDEDFSCSVYIDETQNEEDQNVKNNQKEKLLHGPVLFSSVFDESKSNGRFLIFIPELIHRKSTYVVVKLQQINKIVTTWSQPFQMPKPKPKSEFLISDVLKDVYIGVYQFKLLAPDPFYFPGCRDVLLKDKDFQSGLVEQLIQDIKNSVNIFSENSTIKQSINILIWLSTTYLSTHSKEQRFTLVEIIEENITVFMRTLFMYGDRAICHACVQIMLALKRLKSSKTFESSLHRGLWDIIPHIHNAFSSAAVHSVFLLLCSIAHKFNDGNDMKKLLKLLADCSQSYSSKFSETQKLLITRYGLTGMIMEHSLVDFIYMDIHQTNSSSATTTDNQKKKSPQTFLTSHVPGILEVQLLYFRCVSISEGSKIETSKKKSTNNSNSKMKYGAHGFISDAVAQNNLVATGSMQEVMNVYNHGFIDQFPDLAEDFVYNGDKGYLLVPPPPPPPLGVVPLYAMQPDGELKLDNQVGDVNKDVSPHDVFFQHDKSSILRNLKIQVEKMHVASVHYTIMEFPQTVQITDIIFPPSKSLASVSIFTWLRNETQEDAKLAAYSDEISKKVLILSNLVKPVSADYLKVLIVGGESCSPVISMGQYYGHIKHEVDNPSSCMFKYREVFEEEFCQYILGVDRINSCSIKRDSAHKTSYTSLKKDYVQCRHHFENLSVCQNNVAWRFLAIMEQNRHDNTEQKFKDKSFNTQQLFIYNILQALMKCCSLNSSDNCDIISKNDFVSLFNHLCIYGLQTVTTTALSVLSKIARKSVWWSEALVEIFIASYSSDTDIKPRKRLFNIFVKMVQSSDNINVVVEKFLELLSIQINNLLTPKDSSTSQITMLDWLFLLIINVLDQKDCDEWNFLLPWEHIQTSSNEHADNLPNKKVLSQLAGNTVAEKLFKSSGAGEMKSLKKLSKHSQSAASQSAAKKKNEFTHHPVTDNKNLHIDSTLTFKSNLKQSSFVFIDKEKVVEAVRLSIKFLVSKQCQQNFEQLILLCKLVTLLLSASKSFIELEENLVSPEDLLTLIHMMNSNVNQWFSMSLKILFKHLITHKDNVIANQIPNNLQNNNESLSKIIPASDDDVLNLGKKFFQATASNGMEIPSFSSNSMHTLYPHVETCDEAVDEVDDVSNSDVIHPTRYHFTSFLEDLSNKALKNVLCLEECKNFDAMKKQVIEIDDGVMFMKDLCRQKTNTMMMIMEQLLVYHSNKDLNSDNLLTFLSVLLFFMNLSEQNRIVYPKCLLNSLCEMFIQLHERVIQAADASFNVYLVDVLEKLFELFLAFTNSHGDLQVKLISSMKSIQLFPGNISVKYATLSIEALIAKEKNAIKLSEEEVKTMKLLLQDMLKQRLSTKLFGEHEKLFEDIASSLAFYNYGNNDSADTILMLLDNILCFTKSYVNAIHVATSAGEKFDTKQTVFVVNNGRSRLSGKAHRHDNDIKEALHMIAITKLLIISGNIEDESHVAKEMYRKIQQCIHYSFDLMSAKNQRMGFFGWTKLKGVSDEVLSSTMHPLLSSLVLLYYDPSFDVVLPRTIVNCFVETLKKYTDDEDSSKLNCLRILLAQMISHNNMILVDVLYSDGLPFIVDTIIALGKININYADFLKHSYAIQDLYSSKLSSNSKRLAENDRLKRDVDGVILENFAPYGKITGPSSSASPEVLLLNKSPLRRVRFAAWGHHFQENDDPWIVLEIKLPFQVMLREANIHMHSANLIGSPSELQMLVRSVGGSWISYTPVITTGVINAISMHFAHDFVCKEVMFRLKRPNGSEHIKLNLIELYGRDIYSSPNAENQIIQSKKLNCYRGAVWLDMLTLMVSENETVCEYFKNMEEEKLSLLMSSIVARLPYYSRVSVHHFTLALFNMLLPNIEYLSTIIIKEVTILLSSPTFLNNLRSTPIPLFARIIFEVIIKEEPLSGKQEHAIKYLLEWMVMCLQTLDLNNTIIEDMINCTIQGVFLPLKNISFDKEIAVPDELQSLLRRLLQDDISTQMQQSIGQLLNFLSVLDKDIAGFYVSQAEKVFQERGKFPFNQREINSILSAICCFDKTNHELVKSLDHIINVVCELLYEVLTERKMKPLDEKSLNIIMSAFNLFQSIEKINDEIAQWFICSHNKSFWKPLLETLCSIEPYYPSNNAAIFPLQMETISLFRKLLYLNPENQRIFSLILIDILRNSRVQDENSVEYMNGYAKFLLLQLIISEDNVKVHYESKQASNFLRSQSKVLMPVTSSLTLVEERIRSIVHSLRKETTTENNKESSKEKSDNAEPFEKMSFYLLETTKAVIAKRMPKPKKMTSNISSKGFSLKETDIEFYIPELSSKAWPKNITVGQILQMIYEKNPSLVTSPLVLEYKLVYKKSEWKSSDNDSSQVTPMASTLMNFNSSEAKEFPTSLHIFAHLGGLSLLTNLMKTENKEPCLKLFSLVLSLPGFAKTFLSNRLKAEMLLRIMLGIKETKSGQSISSLKVASELPTLPFVTLCTLLQSTPVNTESGVELRKPIQERNVISIVLESLHKKKKSNLQNGEMKQDIGKTSAPAIPVHTSMAPYSIGAALHQQQQQSQQNYWEKGTGFGTGSTASNWSIEKSMKEKKKEEEQFVIVFQILSAYMEVKECMEETTIDMSDVLQHAVDVIKQSSLLNLLMNYLRNDSVLDLSRHIPLYQSLLSLLKAMATSKYTVCLLIDGNSDTLYSLLTKLKNYVLTYQSKLKLPKKSSERQEKVEKQKSRLRVSKNDSSNSMEQSEPTEKETEELNLLLTFINVVYEYISLKVHEYEEENKVENAESNNSNKEVVEAGSTTEDESYCNEMKELQFDTYSIIEENDDGTIKFNVPFHFANTIRSAVKNADVGNASRARRLAQEVASLSSSLPLSFSSTVFLQCDEERLDVMKVLITGPEETPYDNGCFEFDIYFPTDYPQSPMSVHLQTTGRNTVRFNPNLYNDGKVCLSILNTWHGRPEERWNAQTSNMLQVLVSIQSLILVADPYFNEPGYERLRGTSQGKQNSADYNANIRQATVKWGMLEQLRRPSACFKDIVQKHFLRKKSIILKQVEQWLTEMEEQSTKRKSILHSYKALKKHFTELKHEFAKLEKAHASNTKAEAFPDTASTEEMPIRDISVNSPSMETSNLLGDIPSHFFT